MTDTKIQTLRLSADFAWKNLVADACNIPSSSLRRKRLQQLDTILQAMQESEAYIQKLESELARTADRYHHLREIVQRIVYVCESCEISVHQIGDDVFLTSERLAKVRKTFPHIRLNAIPDKVYDWLIYDERCEQLNPAK